MSNCKEKFIYAFMWNVAVTELLLKKFEFIRQIFFINKKTPILVLIKTGQPAFVADITWQLEQMADLFCTTGVPFFTSHGEHKIKFRFIFFKTLYLKVLNEKIFDAFFRCAYLFCFIFRAKISIQAKSKMQFILIILHWEFISMYIFVCIYIYIYTYRLIYRPIRMYIYLYVHVFTVYIYIHICIRGGMPWRSWLRHCATKSEGRGFDFLWCHWNFSLT